MHWKCTRPRRIRFGACAGVEDFADLAIIVASPGAPGVPEGRNNDMYAIIEDSGTQIKVQKGDLVDIDLREVEDGATITFDKVLAVGDVAGDSAAKIGMPYLSGATVTAKVLGEADGPKVLVGKYKRRKGYRKTIGHRQHYTRIEVLSING
jgi:large subunit ribosomal protein L21